MIAWKLIQRWLCEWTPLFSVLDYLFEVFLTTAGVRQGGPESPPLFNLYIDFVMRVFMDKCSKDKEIRFFNFQYRFNCRTMTREEWLTSRNNNQKTEGECVLPWCGYADDLILFLLDQVGLQKATCTLDDVFCSFGLKINATKTETMCLTYEYPSTKEYPKSI